MTRLNAFLENGALVAQYNSAIGVLRDIGLDRILAELGEPIPVPVGDPQALQMNAFANQQRIGFFQAIEYMFNLLQIVGEKPSTPLRDYGARDNMVALGLMTQEHRDELGDNEL